MQEEEAAKLPMSIPKRIFIVPYRNRIQQKFFFSKYMSFLLEDADDYEIYFSHQCDIRTFNRGATRNIGFLAVKNKYPEHYRDITLIFNDVDTIPFHKIFDYETRPGLVKHYYGYQYALGGIVVIKAGDFERTNGYPCFWGWGLEDNVFQKRCLRVGLRIDRSVFYTIGSPEILQLFDGISRIISKKDPWRMEHDDGRDGLQSIHKLKYSIQDKSDNPQDNIFVVHNERIFVINIYTFLTLIPFEEDKYYNYDLREPKRKIVRPDHFRETTRLVNSTEDWSNIPYYPTMKERREEQAQQYVRSGQPLPPDLVQKMIDDQQKEIFEDAYNKNIPRGGHHVHFAEDLEEEPPGKPQGEPEEEEEEEEEQAPAPMTLPSFKTYMLPPPGYSVQQQPYPLQSQQYPYPAQQPYPMQQPYPVQQQPSYPVQPPHKYAPQYAQYIGQRPRASASARIGLGGVY